MSDKLLMSINHVVKNKLDFPYIKDLEKISIQSPSLKVSNLFQAIHLRLPRLK